MHTETITYFHGETKCLGFMAYDESVKVRRPAILVSPAWRGQDDFARQKAIELAQLGYVGFAIDMYGDGISVADAEAAKYMVPLFLDRKLLQGRIGAAYQCVKGLSLVDPQKIGAIGFCFGGLTVYELLRSGVDIKGAACFHGVFANEREGHRAKTVPSNAQVGASLLILHGDQDPLVSAEDLERVRKEMTAAGVDWQIHIFGNTMHAFTNPIANNPSTGALYNPRSSLRAWIAMQNFFAEVLS